jgi:clan AA aspartic protease
MSIQNGFLDKKGHPRIRVGLRTPDRVSKTLDALIDTGFSGFLAIPEASADDLGLIPVGTVRYTVANGEVIGLILAFGTVTLENDSYAGSIVAGNVRQPLLGVEFLRDSGKALLMDAENILLIDQDAPGELARRLVRDASN